MGLLGVSKILACGFAKCEIVGKKRDWAIVRWIIFCTGLNIPVGRTENHVNCMQPMLIAHSSCYLLSIW